MIHSNPFARIAVAYDGSPAAEAALEHALLLAQHYAGEVIVVHISEFSTAAVVQLETAANAQYVEPAALIASLDQQRNDLFRKVKARVASCDIPVSFEFSSNGAAAGIVDAAERWKATAIAIGTHARTGMARALAGSVAEGVVRSVALPVIVVREGMAAKPLQRILVGINASEPAASASVFAVTIAREHAVRLVYCSILDTAGVAQPIAEMPFDPTPLLAEMRAAARDALDAAVQYANAAGVFPDTEVSEAVHTATGVIDVARRQAADAIVVGTHARGNSARFFAGSTAESIVKTSDVPVMIVPAHASSISESQARELVKTG